MSKRSSSPSAPSVKMSRAEDGAAVRVDNPSELTTHSHPPLQSTLVGPKTRIQQVYVLDFETKLEASIGLNGNQPEVRFTSPDAAICITGDEFLQLANCHEDWPANPIFLQDTRLEPLPDNCFSFVRYSKHPFLELPPAQELDIFPSAIFSMTTCAVQRLKLKLDAMRIHMFKLTMSGPGVDRMFNCIAKVYKAEYARLISTQPILEHFEELSRVIETHVPPTRLVRDFCVGISYCPFNYYSLLSCTLAQKKHIQSLLE